MQSKYASRMTAIPQFTVPEIFVDDEAAHDSSVSPFDGNIPYDSFGPPSPGASSIQSSPRVGAMTPPSGSEAAGPSALRTRISASSIQNTPVSSPVRSRPPMHERTGSDVSENWQFAAQLSRPVSPLGIDNSREGGRDRAGSSVSARDVLDVLDNSAWGESIRKSFSMRRPSGEGGR